MRITPHDLPILTSPRLALVGIDDQVPRSIVLLPPGLVHEGPFESGGEAGSTAAAETGGFDLVDEEVVALEDDILRPMPVASSLCV